MFYFYDPRYHQSLNNGPTAYHPITKPPSVNPRPMYQSANRTHFSPTNSRLVQNQSNQPQYPPVDPDLLYNSANQSSKLMADANLVLKKLGTSKEFCTQLIDAAQRSNHEEVNRLIRSLGTTSDVKVNFNPDGIRLEFHSQVAEIECCQLLVALRWR